MNPTVDLAPATRMGGFDLIRLALVNFLAKGDFDQRVAFARNHFGLSSRAYQLIAKAGVGALGTAGPNGVTPEFAAASQEYLMPVKQEATPTRILHHRDVPFFATVPSMSAGITGYWVAQFKPIPVSKQAITGSSLQPKKVGVIVPISKEALLSDDARVQRVILQDSQRAVVGAVDQAFFDASNSGSDAVPASILDGIDPIPSTGNWRTDRAALLEGFPGDLATSVLLGDTRTGSDLNGADNPDVGARGGILSGFPYLSSSFSPREGSPSTGQIVLLDAAALAVAVEDVAISISDSATLTMSDDPENEGSPQRVSLFQNDLLALKVVLRINWEVQREDAVRWVSEVDYSAE